MTGNTELLEFIREAELVSVPQLQRRFKISYSSVKKVIDELVKSDKMKYLGGLTYCYLYKDEFRPLDGESAFSAALRRRKMLEEKRNNRADRFRELIEARRRSLEEQYEDDEDYDDDEEDSAGLLAFDEDDDDIETDEDEELKKRKFNPVTEYAELKKKSHASLATVLNNIAQKKAEEQKFKGETIEKLETLVRTDKKMAQRGAITKVKNYLEVLAYTSDERLKKIFEGVLAELESYTDADYTKLRARLFET